MSSKEIDRLKSEKLNLIENYINIRKQYQELFYKYKVVSTKNVELNNQIIALQNENKELNAKISENKENKESIEKSVLHENKSLVAKLSQLHRLSSSNATPKVVDTTPSKKSPLENSTSTKSSPIFEVETLIKHRGRGRIREFLVRWKGFKSKDDTWEKEKNLSCPQILAKYKKKHRLQ